MMPLPARFALPARMDALLRSLVQPVRHDVLQRGWAADCGDGRHAFAIWIEGRYLGHYLVLLSCTNCATVEVRDRSIDRLGGLPTGSLAPRRRDELLGWYSGARRAGRVYL